MAAEVKTCVYKTVGSCQIKADVHVPSPGPGRRPVILYIHGGALIYGWRGWHTGAPVEWYLDAGHALVSIDYRLAPESKLPEIVGDVLDAVRWVRESGPDLFAIDPERMAILGHSAGGYLTLMAGCRVRPRPKALVAFYGYGDLLADWLTKPDPFYCRQPAVTEEESGINVKGPVVSEAPEDRGKHKFYLYCRQHGIFTREIGGRDPDKYPAFFTPYCPLKNVTGDYPPTLLLHGTDDTDVPYEQSALMDRELSRHGVEHEFITGEGRGHGFDNKRDDPFTGECERKVLTFLSAHMH